VPELCGTTICSFWFATSVSTLAGLARDLPSSSGEAAAYSKGDAPRSAGWPTIGLAMLTPAPMGFDLSVLSNSAVLAIPAYQSRDSAQYLSACCSSMQQREDKR